MRSYSQDSGVNSYLAELEAFFLGLHKMPRRELDERGLIAADGMEQAGDEIMRIYAAVPSMWTLTHWYENREKYSKFIPGLLLRTPVYAHPRVSAATARAVRAAAALALRARPLRVPGIQGGGDAPGGDVVDVTGHAHLR